MEARGIPNSHRDHVSQCRVHSMTTHGFEGTFVIEGEDGTAFLESKIGSESRNLYFASDIYPNCALGLRVIR